MNRGGKNLRRRAEGRGLRGRAGLRAQGAGRRAQSAGRRAQGSGLSHLVVSIKENCMTPKANNKNDSRRPNDNRMTP